MLFVHEVHTVVGRDEDAFEDAYRRWMRDLGEGDDARLLWFMHHAHGTGLAYQAVTVTAVSDAAAWGRLDERLRTGDLQEWRDHVDGLRHEVTSKVLAPVGWSPLAEVDLVSVPVDGEREQHLFMEDTAWPHRGRYRDYLEKAGTQYLGLLEQGAETGRGMLEMVAGLTPAFGSSPAREVVLWQRVTRPEYLLPLFSTEVPAGHRQPGTWMHDALDVRDRWESRLLRTAPWSPLN